MLLEVFFCTYKVADYGIFFFLKSEKSCWMLKKFTFFQLSILISTISERLDKEIQNNLWLIEIWKCHLKKTISETWVLKQQFNKNYNYKFQWQSKQNKVFLTYWINGSKYWHIFFLKNIILRHTQFCLSNALLNKALVNTDLCHLSETKKTS
jgi:hypothetical protein